MSDPTLLRAVSLGPLGPLAGRSLLVLLHGRGADERDLLPVAEALDLDDAVVAVRAPVPLAGGASWAEGSWDDVVAGRGTGSAADRVIALLDHLAAEHGEPTVVRLLGFSQGAAVALAMARRAPGRYRSVVALSGFVPAEPEPGDALLAEAPIDVFWGRGDADPVIPPAAIERTAAWLRVHARTTEHVYAGLGHDLAVEELGDIRAFLV